MGKEVDVRISVRMPKTLVDWVDRRCVEFGDDRSTVIRQCVLACQMGEMKKAEMDLILARLK